MIDSEDYIDNEICHDCIYRWNFPVGAPCWRCLSDKPFNVTGKYYARELVTNHDRIRSLPLEDLARFFWNADFIYSMTPNEIMDWLREEAKE